MPIAIQHEITSHEYSNFREIRELHFLVGGQSSIKNSTAVGCPQALRARFSWAGGAKKGMSSWCNTP